MGFLTSLFGGGEDGISWLGVGFALIIVLVLVVAGLWALKLLFKASGSVARGRQRRLAVMDTLNMDAKRSLVLIRRDDVEHLLVIGGTQDVVVETGISGATGQTARPPAAAAKMVRRDQVAKDTDEEPDRRRKAAASRLGLTGLLRRYNDPEPDFEPPLDAPEESPLQRLKNLEEQRPVRGATPLRRTGLLRADDGDEHETFDDDSESSVEEPHIPVQSSPDSVMNGADHLGDKTVASAKNEAASRDADSEDANEFAARSAEVTVGPTDVAPEVSVDGPTRTGRKKPLESDLDEDATEPPSPRTQH